MICNLCGLVMERDEHWRQFPDPLGHIWNFHDACYWLTLEFGTRLMGKAARS